jgi:predicted transcriptional regulator
MSIRRSPAVGGGWYPIYMKKTSLYIDPEVDAALARIAERQGITKAELIRRALREAAAAAPRPQISAIGIGEGPGDVSTDIDKHLAETDFGS